MEKNAAKVAENYYAEQRELDAEGLADLDTRCAAKCRAVAWTSVLSHCSALPFH